MNRFKCLAALATTTACFVLTACGDDSSSSSANDVQASDTTTDTSAPDTSPPDTTPSDTTPADTTPDTTPDTIAPDVADDTTPPEDTTPPDDTTGPANVTIEKGDECGSLTMVGTALPFSDSDDTSNYTNQYAYDVGPVCNGSDSGQWGQASPDVVYALTSDADVTVTLTLDPSGFDPGIMATTTCGTFDGCLSVSDTVDAAEQGVQEFLNVDLPANTTVYVLIMGWDNTNPNQGAYEFNVALGEDCSNGVDDNNDNLVDCMDPACNPPQPSATPVSPFCDEGNTDIYPSGCTPGDGVDDDQDGLLDCADPDCALTPACNEGNSDLYPDGCTPGSGTDDDQDGATDCADDDCALSPACDEGNSDLYPDGCSPSDLADDDLDGLLNCADPDCDGTDACDEANATLYPTGCTDGVDNDQDGSSDCDDDDCLVSPQCLGPGDSCDDALPLSLDTPLDGDTNNFNPVYGFGATDCKGVASARGGGLGVGPADAAYVFTPASSGKYTFTLTQPDDFDNVLYIVTDCTDIANECLAARDTAVTSGAEVITLPLQANVSYFAIVDGWLTSDASNVGAYTISVTAADATVTELDCDDDLDNETTPDGDVDCDDSDCLYDSACDEDCDTGEDEDGDGAIDCADSDCRNDANCNELANGAAACSNGSDDDGNGLADCYDATCVDDASCGGVVNGTNCNRPIEVNSVPTTFSTNTCNYTDDFVVAATNTGCQENSSFDPDGPDLVIKFTAPRAGDYAAQVDDAFDAIVNVVEGPACPASPLDNCVDGVDTGTVLTTQFTASSSGQVFYVIIDGWGSGSSACGLLSSVSFVEVLDEVCGDEVDNDLDGDVDCDDDDCADVASCDESSSAFPDGCRDGEDNDGDGATDCDDDQCAAQDLCDESSGAFSSGCDDNLDNDGDGATDCEDLQCLQADPIGCGAPTGDFCDDPLTVGSLPWSSGTLDTCAFHDSVFIGAAAESNSACQSNSATSAAPDVIVRFSAPAAGNYRASFEDDFDGILNVYDGTIDGCVAEPTECVAGDDFGDPPTVVFRADEADQLFYLVGDGWGGASTCGAATFSVESVPDENCADTGIDEDGDGATDCDDSECDTVVACNESLAPGGNGCSDEVDNDMDGSTDCDDANCTDSASCNEFANPNGCTGGVDEDNDGLIDCADPDCSADTVNCPGGIIGDSCGAPLVVDSLPFTWEVDSTCGFADDFIVPAGSGSCADNSSTSTGRDIVFQFAPPSAGKYGVVFNDRTDPSATFDSLVNIIDGTAGGCPTSPVETCVDGSDDPPELQIDAAGGEVFFIIVDGYGSFNPCGAGRLDIFEVPANESSGGLCGDGIDNDLDGQSDCADPDCAQEAACDERTYADGCTNGEDDDGDGAVDCADADCAGLAACNEAVAGLCSDSQDNDGDGAADCADTDCKVADPVACSVPDGELCTLPIVIGSLPYADSQTTCDFENDHLEVTQSGCTGTSGGGEAQEVVYAYTAGNSAETLRITMSGMSSGDSVINVSTSCVPGLALPSCVASVDDTFGDQTETIDVEVAANETIFIYASMWFAATCAPYDLSVSVAP